MKKTVQVYRTDNGEIYMDVPSNYMEHLVATFRLPRAELVSRCDFCGTSSAFTSESSTLISRTCRECDYQWDTCTECTNTHQDECPYDHTQTKTLSEIENMLEAADISRRERKRISGGVYICSLYDFYVHRDENTADDITVNNDGSAEFQYTDDVTQEFIAKLPEDEASRLIQFDAKVYRETVYHTYEDDNGFIMKTVSVYLYL